MKTKEQHIEELISVISQYIEKQDGMTVDTVTNVVLGAAASLVVRTGMMLYEDGLLQGSPFALAADFFNLTANQIRLQEKTYCEHQQNGNQAK